MRLQIVTALAVGGLFGCVGEAEWALQPASNDGVDLGTDGVNVSAFSGLTQGLPGATLNGLTQMNGRLYAVSMGGLYGLDTGASVWESVALPLRPTEKVTSAARFDTAIFVTVADSAGHGGVLQLKLGDEQFTRLTSAPDAPCWLLVKKESALLLSTTGGLFASVDRGVSFTKRSTDTLFSMPLRSMVASPASIRMFAVDGAGALFFSDDRGSTWALGNGLVSGTVSAIEATAQFVLVQTSNGTFRSDNYGNTFHPTTVGSPVSSFAVNGVRAFAGTATGVKISTDGGGTWHDASAGLPKSAAVNGVFLAGSALVASTGEQVYLATVQMTDAPAAR